MEAIINYLDKYTTQIFILQVGLLFILLAIITWVYFYNRKKYNHLKHQIPASVVKNYLDSIIQNSTALKSSLFRGGGLDVDADAIPSVMPLQDLERGASIDLDGKGDEALRAEVAKLRSKVLEKQDIISELEEKTTGLNGVVKEKSERIEELEKLLAEKGDNAASGGSEELESKLSEVTGERDKLKEDLAQYAIIEDDLADLKRLRQENEQLKKSLEEASGGAPKVAAEETIQSGEAKAPEFEGEAEKVEAKEVEVSEGEAKEDKPEDDMSIAAASATDDSDDKSPEDLLSEFEKMLG